MANYQTHVTVSSLLGAGFGTAAALWGGFTPVQGALAGCLTGVAGMLPDLDSDTGKPVREVFSLLAALAPMVLLRRLEAWGGDRDGALLLGVLVYVTIRYGLSGLLNLVSVHRGMFHSIPGMLIAAELTFLAYKHDETRVKFLMALGVALGFASHLILDEIYSVSWEGVSIKLKASAGSALKFFGKSWSANIVTYGLLFTLSYGLLVDNGMVQPPPIRGRNVSLPHAFEEEDDVRVRR